MWLFHHAEGTAGERVQRLGPYLDIIAETWGYDEILAILTYVLSVFGPESPLRGILLESTRKETRQLYATMRDEFIAKGKAEGLAEGRARGEARGEARGIARMLERLLETRGLALTDELRERLAGCRDETLLKRWFDRAVTAMTLTEVFDD